MRRRWQLALIPSVTMAVSACFPTLHTARIDPGLHVDAGVTVLGDQARNGEAQGPDYIAYLAPSFAFGDRVELGLPIGIYLEEGFASLSGDAFTRFGENPQTIVLWPYLKFAMLPTDGPHHLAFIAQGAWMFPGNVGVRYGQDLGSWEPFAGLSLIFSGGPAGDDPVVTRYQESGQSMLALVAGASWNTGGRPTVEIGVLRNRYREGAVYGDFGQPTTARTLYDLFLGARVRLGGP
ncbi:MAG: hypothetical protein OEO20_09640 [Gemmatimonadota bacterium]|nr:hypothetical protein [Gemmatimonadota bacterium]MDH3478554.1 hypothetical protein [Gemmatimonadota bacterium]MDH3571326.1 hypothetical protein [Gemmatimonadota bacterium]MDH5549327.1 hypothetical protein [Gemmatimonadota bacterium]